MHSKALAALISVLFLLGLVSVISAGQKKETVAPVSVGPRTKGSPSAEVKLIEYSDFQCPACAAYYPMVKQLVSDMSLEILFEYRHFPLPQHQNANLAAHAAEAAGKQGKFWEMHDLIFDRQDQWASSASTNEQFLSYARELKLNIEQFDSDLKSEEIKSKVKNDYNQGVFQKVDSTPKFFLNGEKIDNPRSLEEFKSIIMAAKGPGNEQ